MRVFRVLELASSDMMSLETSKRVWPARLARAREQVHGVDAPPRWSVASFDTNARIASVRLPLAMPGRRKALGS